MPAGGYQQPSDPAPVSGPGALSQRTDGGPGANGGVSAPTSPTQNVNSNGTYGDAGDMQQIQGGSPMLSKDNLTPINAPTARPSEPITAGANSGPGINMQQAGIQTDDQMAMQAINPMLYSLNLIASLPSANPETKTFVRALTARVSQQQQGQQPTPPQGR